MGPIPPIPEIYAETCLIGIATRWHMFVYIWTHVCVYIYTHVYIYTYIHMYICKHTYIYICIYIIYKSDEETETQKT
jgi:hypothetical protein